MLREEAITVLKAFMDNPLFSDQHKAAFSIAIHDIKQHHEWDINNLILIFKDNYEPQEPKSEWQKDHAILKAYSDGANEIIDKIRAEIEQIIGEHNLDDYDFCSGLICARRIIDKYKAESEET